MAQQKPAAAALQHAVVRKGIYNQSSIKERILAFFLDNLGKVASRDQIEEVARDPSTGKAPENWHQRLSELRTDDGYTILSNRDMKALRVSEYLMLTAQKRPTAAKRVRPTPKTWAAVLERSANACEWAEGDNTTCGLQDGDIDSVGGGTVRLTPDHKMPHSVNPTSDPHDPTHWQALCGRHQVMKKNYWDSLTGKVNAIAIVQAAPHKEKEAVYEMLKRYFGDP
ncbi:MAG: hypothetical protein WD801_11525 [Gemmatimonadaceae bacterium]